MLDQSKKFSPDEIRKLVGRIDTHILEKIHEFYFNPEVDYLHLSSNQEGFSEVLVPDRTINVFPGSFNPLNIAHESTMSYIYRISDLNDDFAVEISINRLSKPAYSFEELIKIVEQFAFRFPVILTKKEWIYQKISLLREYYDNINMYIGYDTFKRLLDCEGIERIHSFGATFYVSDRIIDGKHFSASDIVRKYPNIISVSITSNSNILSSSSTELRKIEEDNQKRKAERSRPTYPFRDT